MRSTVLAAVFTATVFICTGAAAGRAQQPPAPPAGEVRGAVLGADHAPLSTATIELYAHRDSTLAAGAIADQAGRFRIDGVRPGQYRLRVIYPGHAPHLQDVAVTPAALRVDLGMIRLAAAAVALDAIEAAADRGTIALDVDRTVYHARQAATAGGNATDILRNVPGVDVDIDGRISVRGSNVVVQINGRAAPLHGDALTNFLKQLPASTVTRVEVMPNPSAKYDPEGMGGIVNIVLQQGTDLGLSGSFNAAVGTNDKRNGSGTIGYQAGRIMLLGTIGYNDDTRSNDLYIYRSNDFNAARTYFEQNTSGALHNTGLVFNSSAEVKLAAHSSLAASLLVNRMTGDLDGVNALKHFDADRTLMLSSTHRTDLDQKVNVADVSVAFRRIVAPARNELTAELRYDRANDDLLSLFDVIEPLSGNSTPTGQSVARLTRNITLQADVVRVAAGLKLELGQKTTLRGLDNERAQIPPDNSAMQTFTYDERIFAGYALLSRDVGRFALQGGVRAEHTTTDFDAVTASFDDGYVNLFPSAAALYSFTPTRKLRVSYSRRIQRPNSRFLNPFPVSDDPRNVLVGNPELKPELTDAVELSLQQTGRHGSIQLQPFVRRTSEAIRVIKRVAEDGVATTTFANLTSANSYGSDATVTGRIRTINGMLGFSAFQLNTSGSTADGALSSASLTWNARANMSWAVTPRLTAQWTVFHRAPLNMEQGRVKSLTVTSFALQQKLLDRATIALRVSDPLDAMRLSFTTADAYHAQTSWRKVESRIAHLSFTYSFGSQPRIRQQQQQQDDAAAVRIF